MLQAPILGFPTENDRFILDTDASLFAVGGVVNQVQGEVVPAASLYHMTRNVGSCCNVYSFSQKFRNSDGMLARWYMLLCQFSVTCEYRPGSQHANADGLSRQCGQCLRLDCPVLSPDVRTRETESMSVMVHQPFAASAMGESMDSDLLPELLCATWVAATHLDEVTGDLPPSGSEPDLITASRIDKTLLTVWEWVRTGSVLSGQLFGLFGPEISMPSSGAIWDMSRWFTDGTGWLWIFWICW